MPKKITSKARNPKAPKNPQRWIDIPFKLSARDAVDLIAANFDHETIVHIIAGLDGACEDWGVTERLCRHFAAMAETGRSLEDPNDPDDRFDFSPKLLSDDLKYGEAATAISKAMKCAEAKPKANARAVNKARKNTPKTVANPKSTRGHKLIASGER